MRASRTCICKKSRASLRMSGGNAVFYGQEYGTTPQGAGGGAAAAVAPLRHTLTRNMERVGADPSRKIPAPPVGGGAGSGAVKPVNVARPVNVAPFTKSKGDTILNKDVFLTIGGETHHIVKGSSLFGIATNFRKPVGIVKKMIETGKSYEEVSLPNSNILKSAAMQEIKRQGLEKIASKEAALYLKPPSAKPWWNPFAGGARRKRHTLRRRRSNRRRHQSRRR
jgi:hypothetical protein